MQLKQIHANSYSISSIFIYVRGNQMEKYQYANETQNWVFEYSVLVFSLINFAYFQLLFSFVVDRWTVINIFFLLIIHFQIELLKILNKIETNIGNVNDLLKNKFIDCKALMNETIDVAKKYELKNLWNFVDDSILLFGHLFADLNHCICCFFFLATLIIHSALHMKFSQRT